ncbi:MAG: hypothetical protein JNM84_11425 [Planctomycetes bacterium]|nr:hypothetical protein [Planctomycetota bacterium]
MNGARVLLAIAVLACMVGLLRFGSEGWGPLFAWLWTEGGYDEAGALAALRNAGWCGVGLALLAPFRPLGLLGLPLAAWCGAWCAATLWQREAFAELAPALQATRFTAPLGLALLAATPARPGSVRMLTAAALLCCASAATFAAHGLEAYTGHGEFLDFLFLLARELELALAESTARGVLLVIAALDVAAALGALLALRWRRARLALAWMGAWGLATAALRLFAYGSAFYADFLVRLPNACVPLAALALLRARDRQRAEHLALDASSTR